VKQRARALFAELQQSICAALEKVDGSARFSEEPWEHVTGGGGLTRVLSGGAVFEIRLTRKGPPMEASTTQTDATVMPLVQRRD